MRREKGYCRIAWTQSDDPDSFKVGRPFGNYNSLTGSASCDEDYVTIPQGSNEGQHLNGVSACSTPAVSNLPTIDRSDVLILSASLLFFMLVHFIFRHCGGWLTCVHANDQADAGRRTIIRFSHEITLHCIVGEF